MPDVVNRKVSAPIVFHGYPKDGKRLPFPTLGPIPGLAVRMIIHDASEGNPNVFEIPRQEYEQDGKRRVMSSQAVVFDHWVYRYDVEGKVVAYNFRLTPTDGHWVNGKWIEDGGELACEFSVTFIDDKGDGVFRVLLPRVLTPDAVPQWALDRRRIPN